MFKDLATLQPDVTEALEILGIRNLLLGIHDTAFPALSKEDIGCGTPYSQGARQFLQFARETGFNGIQLGPQGITSPGNPSPYDGTFFSKDPLLLAPLVLTGAPWYLLDPVKLAELITERPREAAQVHRVFADKINHQISAMVGKEYRKALQRNDAGCAVICNAFENFRKSNAAWLLRDALYEVLQSSYGGRNWSDWTGRDDSSLDRQLFVPQPGSEQTARMRIMALRQKHHREIEDFCLTQFLIAEQHKALRKDCRRLSLKLFGDCQIGFSDRDTWVAQAFLLPGYRLGAPPSRTNPEGQPWNFPVLDPRQYDLVNQEPGPAVRFLRARVDKLFAEFDGLRIDHPHGLICPWVYRADIADPLQAVKTGGRLFASPMLVDHPGLASFAITRSDQINYQVSRHDDAWVVDLDSGQVRQYGRLFKEIVEAAGGRQEGPGEIACEILSTQPYPIKQVMDSYGLGRFRVTQKADLGKESDVYRSENARPEDWLMLGNHDTPPIWMVAEGWCKTGEAQQQAAYLAGRLRIPEAMRTDWIERIAGDPGRLVQAKFADLFVGPAKNIMVYFTDLLGMHELYNRPGSISDANWSLRVAADYKTIYQAKLAKNQALNLPVALALALRAQGQEVVSKHRQLISLLESSIVS
ncbi:MAG: 4-alpha-glucanotransferase [Desulfuromonadales bacterium]